jgi:shikimate dehydrogenase
VNCAIRSNGRWIGANTDGQGFLASLRSVADPAGQRALILGAGGAARAIAVELALAGSSEIWVANRNVSKASDIAKLVSSDVQRLLRHRVQANLAVPEWPPLSSTRRHWDCPAEGAAGFRRYSGRPGDVIPNPPDTPFLRRARQAGATTVDGRGMLLNQAAINIKFWTGIDPDREVMGRALDQAIANWAHP